MKRTSNPRSSKRRKKQPLPPGWDENRIKEVIDYYENQTADEQVAEHEAAFKTDGHTVMVVPTELVPKIQIDCPAAWG
jgi:hypothetical protein